MGRSREAKLRRHAKAMAKRRAIKAAKRAAYQARIAAGTNRKSKQRNVRGRPLTHFERVLMLVPVRINSELKTEKRKVHGGVACRNVGCLRCSEVARKAA